MAAGCAVTAGRLLATGRVSKATRLISIKCNGETLSEVTLPPHDPQPSVIDGGSAVENPIAPCVVGVFTVMRDAGLQIVRGAYYFGFVFPLAAAVRLIERNTIEPRSSLKKHGALTNGILGAACATELPLFPFNRLAGLSAFVLAKKA